MSLKFVGRAALVAAGCSLLAGAASAGVLWTAKDGARAASADFVASGGKLYITLINTALGDATSSSDVLTGIFFDVTGSALSLTRTSVVIPSGSGAFYSGSGAVAPTDAGGIVGGEWAYKGAMSGAPHNAKYGISSAGLGLFGSGDRFAGSNLQGPNSPDGVQYGITTAGDKLTTGNGGLSGQALIKNRVIITLSGIASNFDLTKIKKVNFQYGTTLSECNLEAGCVTTPTPGAVALLGLSGLVGLRRRR